MVEVQRILIYLKKLEFVMVDLKQMNFLKLQKHYANYLQLVDKCIKTVTELLKII